MLPISYFRERVSMEVENVGEPKAIAQSLNGQPTVRMRPSAYKSAKSFTCFPFAIVLFNWKLSPKSRLSML